MSNSAAVSLFIERFEEQGGEVERVAGLEEALTKIAEEVARSGMPLAVASCDQRVLEFLKRETRGKIELVPPKGPLNLIERAGAGLTFPAAGVAETGSILEICYDDADRLVSSLPPIHFAYLRSGAIVPSLLDIGWVIRDAHRNAPFTATLISGPSRTGDIELTLVKGVHGPHTVKVFLEV
jgi:L-lactate dehydrogenase complex protein LldG